MQGMKGLYPFERFFSHQHAPLPCPYLFLLFSLTVEHDDAQPYCNQADRPHDAIHRGMRMTESGATFWGQICGRFHLPKVAAQILRRARISILPMSCHSASSSHSTPPHAIVCHCDFHVWDKSERLGEAANPGPPESTVNPYLLSAVVFFLGGVKNCNLQFRLGGVGGGVKNCNLQFLTP